MGLRCLIGHDYGEPQTERDREEQGDEMVVTVREYKECARCGHQQVVSENKEVTSVATEPEPDPGPERPAESAGGGADDEYGDLTAEEDDGVILDDDAADERAPGEWPDADDEDDEPEDVEHEDWPDADDEDDEPEDVEHEDWPDVGDEDEGYDAGPADAAPADDVEFRGGLTPEAGTPRAAIDDDDVDDEETVAAAAPDADSGGGDRGPTGIRSATPGPEPTRRQIAGAGNTEFACPECGHTAPAVESSLRPGDICPECQRGYLTERVQSDDSRNG